MDNGVGDGWSHRQTITLHSLQGIPPERRICMVRMRVINWFLRAGPMIFYCLELLDPLLSSTVCLYSSLFLLVKIVGLGSWDWYDINHSLRAMHCRPRGSSGHIYIYFLLEYIIVLMLETMSEVNCLVICVFWSPASQDYLVFLSLLFIKMEKLQEHDRS